MTIKTAPSQYQNLNLPSHIHVMDTALALKALAKIKAVGVDNAERPETLTSEQIDTIEQVFQARSGQLNEQHLGELESAIKAQGPLDPLIVWRCGNYAVLLEGHHRLEAYRRVDVVKHQITNIPVRWFEGTVEEAAIRAASANSRAKLQMTHAERSDHAWKMVKTGLFKVSDVIEATTISKRTIITMRKVADKLGKDAAGCDNWQRALKLSKGDSGSGWEPDEVEAQIEAEAQKIANSLLKNHGMRLSRNPEITAKALSIHLNRMSQEIIKCWIAEMGYDEDALGDEGEDEGEGDE